MEKFTSVFHGALKDAAPDLLEAAYAALKLLRGSGFTESNMTIVLLRRAIEKAEGEVK